MFTLVKVVGERARSATTFTMITNHVCQLYHNWSKTGGIQLLMVLPWIWVVLWICNAGDLALTCAGFSRAWGQIFRPICTDGIQKTCK